LNYAGQFQDPISSYGAQSVSKLQEVRKRVDPARNLEIWMILFI